jgi:hypothetical protein
MSKTCEDCGCRVSKGICSNCDEESWIEEFQGDCITTRSNEWLEKLDEQAVRIEERLGKEKPTKYPWWGDDE